MRSFLTLHDLGNAIHALISKTNPTDDTLLRFNIWHLASFDATVLKIASTIASLTGASIDSNSQTTNFLLSFHRRADFHWTAHRLKSGSLSPLKDLFSRQSKILTKISHTQSSPKDLIKSMRSEISFSVLCVDQQANRLC